MKTGVPMITIRTVRAKLNKEALGKMTEEAVHLLKFGQ